MGAGRKKKPALSTAELLERSSQNKAHAGGASKEQADSWEDDAALIAAEQDSESAAPEVESAEAQALREEHAATRKRVEAEVATRRAEAAKAAKEASKAAKAAQEAVAEAMAAKRKKSRGKGKPPAAAVQDADPQLSAQTARANPRPDRVEPAAQRSHAATAADAPPTRPLLEEVPAPSAVHVQPPEELVEEWQMAAGGGFEPRLLGVHPGISCDVTSQIPLLGMRYQLGAEECDAAAHPHGYDVCAQVHAKLSPAEQARYDEIPPPCMAPLAYVLGSREHRTYVLMGLVYM